MTDACTAAYVRFAAWWTRHRRPPSARRPRRRGDLGRHRRADHGGHRRPHVGRLQDHLGGHRGQHQGQGGRDRRVTCGGAPSRTAGAGPAVDGGRGRGVPRLPALRRPAAVRALRLVDRERGRQRRRDAGRQRRRAAARGHRGARRGRASARSARRPPSSGRPTTPTATATPDTVVLEVVARPPRFIPPSIGGAIGLDEVRRTVRVRIEEVQRVSAAGAAATPGRSAASRRCRSGC